MYSIMYVYMYNVVIILKPFVVYTCTICIVHSDGEGLYVPWRPGRGVSGVCTPE